MTRDTRRTNVRTSRGTAHVDGSEGSDRTTNPSFLQRLTPDRDSRPTLHTVHPDDWTRSLCGAPVIGILVYHQPLECVVCAGLLEGRKG